MKKTHLAALVCFAISVICYVVASSSVAGGGFAFLGFVFELMAWRKVGGAEENPKSTVTPPALKIPRRWR